MSHRFHRHLGLTAVILTLAGAALASAPVALAQNAGDDQYADPFGNLPEDQGGGDPGAGAPAEPQAAPAPEGSAAGPGRALNRDQPGGGQPHSSCRAPVCRPVSRRPSAWRCWAPGCCWCSCWAVPSA